MRLADRVSVDKFFTAVAIAKRPSVLGQLIRKHHSGGVGLSLVIVICLVAILAPWLAPYDIYAISLQERTQPPSREHLLGTDQLGRDLLSRVIFGARISLVVGLFAVSVGASIGIVVGLVSGFLGGWVDAVLMRVIDILLAFPLYLLALATMAILGRSLMNVLIAVGIASFPSYARLARGEVLHVKTREYVEAARAIGAGNVRILRLYVLPNIQGPLVVMATLRVGYAILVEASLSFLGVGVPPPAPSWGGMVNEGLQFIWTAPWLLIFPGLAIMLITLGSNLLGDGLRDILDPRLHGA